MCFTSKVSERNQPQEIPLEMIWILIEAYAQAMIYLLN